MYKLLHSSQLKSVQHYRSPIQLFTFRSLLLRIALPYLMWGRSAMSVIPGVVYPLPWPLLVGGGEADLPASGPPASFSVHLSSSAFTLAGSVHKSRMTMWCVCGCNWRNDVCCVCEGYKGEIVVMDVFWRRLSELGKGVTSEEGR